MAILAFDHGTTGIRACVFDAAGQMVGRGYRTFEQIYPQPGWVEHQPNDIWELTIPVAEEALTEAKLSWSDIAGIGLTNQRETTILWDVETGEPVYNAIVWQCRRTADLCEQLKQDGHADLFQQRTGLVLDPYFSGTKIRWLFDNVPAATALAEKGTLRFGTVDTWVLWHLTGRKHHVTDPTNASRTLLFDIENKQWDPDLLKILDIPSGILPTVVPSSGVLGHTDPSLTGGVAIPIAGLAGDQQAALFGQLCWEAGAVKSTYGTGTFVMMNTGQRRVVSESGLLTTLACDANGDPCYALEGSIFVAGAAINWLEKKLGLIASPQEADELAAQVEDTGGVYFVPAFVGLGAPYWDPDARGAIVGLTQDTSRAHIARACLEAMAYQTKDVLDLMQQEATVQVTSLKVDGGVSRSAFLCQFLADTLPAAVVRTVEHDLTVRGAAYLAGLALGVWGGSESLTLLGGAGEQFVVSANGPDALRVTGWRDAVARVRCSSGK